MKKILPIILIALLGSCSVMNFHTGTMIRIVTPDQLLSALPTGFVYVANAGHGWHYCKDPVGRSYLVSIQGNVGEGTFVQMTWTGE